jgi:hypothetical protein
MIYHIAIDDDDVASVLKATEQDMGHAKPASYIVWRMVMKKE